LIGRLQELEKAGSYSSEALQTFKHHFNQLQTKAKKLGADDAERRIDVALEKVKSLASKITTVSQPKTAAPKKTESPQQTKQLSKEEIEKIIQQKEKYLADTAEKILSLRDADNNTPLHVLCKKEPSEVQEITQEMIKVIERADKHLLEARNNAGENAFSLACLHGHTDIVKAIIEKDPSVLQDIHSLVDAQGNTPLQVICGQNLGAVPDAHIEVAKLFIKNQDSNLLNYRNADRITAFEYACVVGNKELAQLFINARRPDLLTTQDENQFTPLHLLCELEPEEGEVSTRQEEIAKMLINALSPEQLEARNEDGDTALDLATKNHLQHIVALFPKNNQS